MSWRARAIGIAVAAVVVAAALLTLRAPAAAAPPGDVAAYCRAANPQMQFQVRCLYLEKAAQERIARATPAVDRDALARCQGSSGSWTEMEHCLAAPAPSAATPGGGAAVGSSAPGGAAGDGRDPARPPGGGGPAGAVASPPPAPPSLTPPGAAPPQSPSTVILGPRSSTPAAGDDRNRPSRPISDADAERQLRGVLEREGETAAKCTRKPYGPGWVTVCE